MFKAAVIPTLLYLAEHEAWTPLFRHIKRLQSLIPIALLSNHLVKENQRNTDVRAKAGINTVETMS